MEFRKIKRGPYGTRIDVVKTGEPTRVTSQPDVSKTGCLKESDKIFTINDLNRYVLDCIYRKLEPKETIAYERVCLKFGSCCCYFWSKISDVSIYNDGFWKFRGDKYRQADVMFLNIDKVILRCRSLKKLYLINFRISQSPENYRKSSYEYGLKLAKCCPDITEIMLKDGWQSKDEMGVPPLLFCVGRQVLIGYLTGIEDSKVTKLHLNLQDDNEDREEKDLLKLFQLISRKAPHLKELLFLRENRMQVKDDFVKSMEMIGRNLESLNSFEYKRFNPGPQLKSLVWSHTVSNDELMEIKNKHPLLTKIGFSIYLDDVSSSILMDMDQLTDVFISGYPGFPVSNNCFRNWLKRNGHQIKKLSLVCFHFKEFYTVISDFCPNLEVLKLWGCGVTQRRKKRKGHLIKCLRKLKKLTNVRMERMFDPFEMTEGEVILLLDDLKALKYFWFSGAYGPLNQKPDLYLKKVIEDHLKKNRKIVWGSEAEPEYPSGPDASVYMLW